MMVPLVNKKLLIFTRIIIRVIIHEEGLMAVDRLEKINKIGQTRWMVHGKG
jgi:hypothetical protein